MQYVKPFNETDENAGYVDETATVSGSIVPAAAIEYPQREIVAAIKLLLGEDAPTNTSREQLAQGILQKALIPGVSPWNEEWTYKAGNVAIYDDKMYMALAGNINKHPSTSAEWKALVEMYASDSLPKDLSKTASAGMSTDYARADHVHKFVSPLDTSILGKAATAGRADSALRADSATTAGSATTANSATFADQLRKKLTINGVEFNGTKDVTVENSLIMQPLAVSSNGHYYAPNEPANSRWGYLIIDFSYRESYYTGGGGDSGEHLEPGEMSNKCSAGVANAGALVKNFASGVGLCWRIA